MRLANAQTAAWRNSGNTNDHSIQFDAADDFLVKIDNTTEFSVSSTDIDMVSKTVSNCDDISMLSGSGINFSADGNATGMTSELLDDYEEGTWTPVLSDGTNDATTSLASGSYTKIGDLVTVRGRLTVSAKGSISGGLRITGLPFTNLPNNAASMAAFNIGYCAGASITAGYTINGYIPNNQSYALLRIWDATGGQTALQDTEVGASLSSIFTASYSNKA